MLSERLKGKTLFVTVEEHDVSRLNKSLDLLEECVDHLILLMRTIETEGILPREDIEDYVISYMDAYERRYYGYEEDELDAYIDELLRKHYEH